MNKYDSTYSAIKAVNEALGYEALNYDSTYDAALALLLNLGGEDKHYDSLYSIMVELAMMAENGEIGGGGGGSSKPKIYNGFAFTGGDIAQVDFSQYDWGGVYDTSEFFQGCHHSTEDWSNFEQNYNGKVLNCYKMFYNCSSLTTIPQLDTSSVTNMRDMFYTCSSLTTIPQLDTSSVTNMRGMFSGSPYLTTVTQLDTSSVTEMIDMFRNCSSLTSVRFKGNPSKVTSVTDMFKWITTTGTLYYDERYDYSKIINVMPSTWTAIPYNVEEYEASL